MTKIVYHSPQEWLQLGIDAAERGEDELALRALAHVELALSGMSGLKCLEMAVKCSQLKRELGGRRGMRQILQEMELLQRLFKTNGKGGAGLLSVQSQMLRLYEQAGDFSLAMQLYEQSNETLRAASPDLEITSAILHELGARWEAVNRIRAKAGIHVSELTELCEQTKFLEELLRKHGSGAAILRCLDVRWQRLVRIALEERDNVRVRTLLQHQIDLLEEMLRSRGTSAEVMVSLLKSYRSLATHHGMIEGENRNNLERRRFLLQRLMSGSLSLSSECQIDIANELQHLRRSDNESEAYRLLKQSSDMLQKVRDSHELTDDLNTRLNNDLKSVLEDLITLDKRNGNRAAERVHLTELERESFQSHADSHLGCKSHLGSKLSWFGLKGSLEIREGNTAAARQNVQRGLEVANELGQDLSFDSWLPSELLQAARLEWQRGALASAYWWFSVAVSVFQQTWKLGPGWTNWQDLNKYSNTQYEIFKLEWEMSGDIDEKLYYERCIHHFDDLVKSYGSDWVANWILCHSHRRLGQLHHLNGSRAQAMLHYELSMAVNVIDCTDDVVSSERFICALGLGDLDSEVENWEGAWRHYIKAIEALSLFKNKPGSSLICIADSPDVGDEAENLRSVWPRTVLMSSERLLGLAYRGAFSLETTFNCRLGLGQGLHDTEDLTLPSEREYLAPTITSFHSSWLRLAIKYAPERIPEILGEAQGRKLAALILDELEHDKLASGAPEIIRQIVALRVDLRRKAIGLKFIEPAPSDSAENIHSSDESPDTLGLVAIPPDVSRRRLTEFLEARDEYYNLRNSVPFEHREYAALSPEPLRYSFDQIQAKLAPAHGLLLLVHAPFIVGTQRVSSAKALLIRSGRPPKLLALSDLAGLHTQLDAQRLKFLRGRKAGDMRDCLGSRRGFEVAGEDAPWIDPEGALVASLWKPVAPYLDGLQTLHIASHGDLHNLPLTLGAPKHLTINQYPGLVYYWMAQSRSSCEGLRLDHANPLRALVYTPTSTSKSGSFEGLSPIPHVKTEYALAASCWRRENDPFDVRQSRDGHPATLTHIACHGTFQRDGKNDPCLILGPETALSLIEVLNGDQSSPVVYLSACFVGRSEEDQDGDPLGLVGGFMLRGAQIVLAALNPIDDFWAPLLAYLFHRTLKAQSEHQGRLDPLRALTDAKRQVKEGDWVPQCVPSSDRARWSGDTDMMVVQAYAPQLAEEVKGTLDTDMLPGLTEFLRPLAGLSAVGSGVDTDGCPKGLLKELYDLPVPRGESAQVIGPARAQMMGEKVAQAIVRSKGELFYVLPAVEFLLQDMQAFGDVAVDPAADLPEYHRETTKIQGHAANEARPAEVVESPVAFGAVGRNEACPCGSGQKYKACHGKLT